MCGICGIIITKPGVVEPTEVESITRKMARTLTHRGPDDEGVEVFIPDNPGPKNPIVGLGHRRLSIIDLEGGHQPLSNEDESVWTVANGEIYNFPELRSQLKRNGHGYRTQSDTESLVHLYEDYGHSMVNRLVGMYGFAIWDARRRRLMLARDRLGQKPLYYIHDKTRGLFAFASELKALLQIPGFDRSVDAHAVYNYLHYRYVPHPHSIFDSVEKLSPAHTLEFSPLDGDVKLERYWKPDFNADFQLAPEDMRQQVKDTLYGATRLRMRSDVPVGVFLSGGIDSSIAVALMSKAGGERIRTFSIGFEEKEYDETEYARMVSRRYQTEHTEKVVRPDAVEVLPKLVWHYDEPFGDPSAVPTYYVAKSASKYVKVVLTGDAGDECFGGYERYLNAHLEDKIDGFPFNIISGCSLWDWLPVTPASTGLVARLRRTMYRLRMNPVLRYAVRQAGLMDRISDGLFSPCFKNKAEEWSIEAFLRPYFDEAGGDKFGHKALYVDLMTYLPCDLLNKVDIASMAHGLETRSPFLDHRVVELAGRIQFKHKVGVGRDGFRGKKILKETFKDELPDSIIKRKKMGFAVPVGKWLREDLSELMQDTLLSRRCIERGYFQREGMEDMVRKHLSGEVDLQHPLWTLLMLELWHRRFVD